MQIVRSLADLPSELRGGAVTIGNFDGVHRGHAQLIERLVAQAKRVGGPAVVFTFDPHPLALLKPEIVPTPMTRVARKAELLGELGATALIAYPTDWALLKLDPQQFFDLVIGKQLAAQAIVEGPNFQFGRERTGNIGVLRELCQQAAIELEVLVPICFGEVDHHAERAEYSGEATIISSSRVRNLIQAGQVGRANEMLTQPYRIRGIVARGAARGRTISFPTANLEQIETVLPAPGVYAARCWVDGQAYKAAVNVGANPTFGDSATKIEVHLIDFQGDLYDQTLSVDFLDRLRDIQQFSSVDDLVAQLHRDVAAARRQSNRCAVSANQESKLPNS